MFFDVSCIRLDQKRDGLGQKAHVQQEKTQSLPEIPGQARLEEDPKFLRKLVRCQMYK